MSKLITNVNTLICIGDDTSILTEDVTNGTIYFSAAGNMVAFDWNNERKFIKSFFKVTDYSTYQSMTKIGGTFYFILSTNEMYYYDGTNSIKLSGEHLPDVSISDNGKILRVENGAWNLVTPSIIYTGNNTPSSSLGNNGDVYLQITPTVIYETDGTTGLLGVNATTFANSSWQLENIDLTPYKYINCYFKAANTNDDDKYTPAHVVTVPLDSAALGNSLYTGGKMVLLPFYKSHYYSVTCAVDSTKTKFQVIHQNMIFSELSANTLLDTSIADANNTGRYCYKIEGLAI